MFVDLKNASGTVDHNFLLEKCYSTMLFSNITKTELIIVHSSSKKTGHSLNFKLGRKRLTQIDIVKYLDVLLDDHLLWSKQINHVTNKLHQAIDILSRLRSRAFLKILKMTYYSYYSFFCSYLLYGAQIWNQSNKTSQNNIQKL